jgi:hypothetical protein
MSVLDRIAAKRRRDEVEAPTRATCLRCRREYTPEPNAVQIDMYCWWCAARMASVPLSE